MINQSDKQFAICEDILKLKRTKNRN